MNREILFKGKRVDNGEWVEGFYCPRPYSHFPCEPSIFPIATIDKEWYGIEVIPETVGQYTGLTDKNGVKIFEGDILKFRSGIYSVEWDNEHSKFLQRDGQFSRELHIWIAKSEIVGNIHDNPELLKGEENE